MESSYEELKAAKRNRTTRSRNNDASFNTTKNITQINVSNAATNKSGIGRHLNLEQCITQLLLRDDGYLRIIPDDKLVFHFYWQFTRGQHAGKYCYWGISRGQSIPSGITGLHRKLQEIDAGLRKPSQSEY